MMRVRLLAPRRARATRLLAALLLLTCVAGPRDARARQAQAPQGQPAAANTPPRRPFAPLAYRQIGPWRGGRSAAVAGVPAQPFVYYFGATGGGVWKTTDGGMTWEPLGEQTFKTGSVGAVAVSESDPNVVYVGMGEQTLRGNVSHGDGMYKSTDAGKTWKQLSGLDDTRHISRVRVHPRNPDLVYVAAIGHAFGPNEQRGVFRSKDGGRTWEKVLYRGPQAGAIDLDVRPVERRGPLRRTLAGHPPPLGSRERRPRERALQVHRRRRHLEGDHAQPGSAARARRQDRRDGLGRRARPRVGDRRGGGRRRLPLRRRRRQLDEGQRVARPAGSAPGTTRASTPTRRTRTRVYVLNVGFHRSNDGGRTFTRLPTPHGDNHDLWIAPDDPNRMIEANDGGANVSFNGGRTWTRAGSADRAVLPRGASTTRSPTTSTARSRTTRPSPSAAARRASASTATTGTTWAAARRAGSRRSPATRTSSSPAPTAAISRATTTARSSSARSTSGPTTRWGTAPRG